MTTHTIVRLTRNSATAMGYNVAIPVGHQEDVIPLPRDFMMFTAVFGAVERTHPYGVPGTWARSSRAVAATRASVLAELERMVAEFASRWPSARGAGLGKGRHLAEMADRIMQVYADAMTTAVWIAQPAGMDAYTAAMAGGVAIELPVDGRTYLLYRRDDCVSSNGTSSMPPAIASVRSSRVDWSMSTSRVMAIMTAAA